MPITTQLVVKSRLVFAVVASFVSTNAPAQISKSESQPIPVPAIMLAATSEGPPEAPVAIVVFSDFESFPCSRSASVLTGLLGQTTNIRLIFKHAPAMTNPNALLAHEAALAAAAQGKFWEMHDVLFENQSRLSRADLLKYARDLNLNLPVFQQALDNHTYRPIIERDLAEAKGLGVTATPTLFVNGRRLVGPQGYASLGAVVASAVAGIPKSQTLPEVAAGPAQAINLEHAPSNTCLPLIPRRSTSPSCTTLCRCTRNRQQPMKQRWPPVRKANSGRCTICSSLARTN
jgi:protein-disulfide isomerase